MSDSAFWRRLATRFRKLQPKRGKGLSLEWFEIDPQWPGGGKRWDFRGAPSASVLRRFNQAAQVAARTKTRRRGSSVDTWLNLLKEERDAFHVKGSTRSRWQEQSGEWVERSGEWGEIPRVCEVSADYCEAGGPGRRSRE